jgi:2-keto-4-pentenoate hydratase/2-oxohepta-3-ene-1,7-dioic acid hydratase in catechol pathway
MKLATFALPASPDHPRFGVVTDAGIIDLSGDLPQYTGLRQILADGALDVVRAAATRREPGVSLADVVLLPVIPNPGKILCAGLNYHEHREEAGRDQVGKPTIFIRFADTQIGAGATVPLPPSIQKLDYEGELAVVVGRHGSQISAADSFSYIAGYACYDDFSARDWQRHSSQWTAGKNFPGTGAFGPVLVTTDEIPDVQELILETRVNGEVRQSASVADLIFSIPDLIEYVSSFTPLAPGDVIVTGTPGGVGMFREPPEFLRHGDVVEVQIDRVGLLRNVVG